MSQNLSNFDAALKTYYLDKIPELINQKINLKEHFTDADGKGLSVDGRYVEYPLHVGRNVGTGAIAEGATLPKAGNQRFVTIRVPFRYNYGRIELTSQVIEQSKTSKGAFAKAVDTEIKNAAKDVGREINRQLWLDGKGILAKVATAVSNGTTVELKDPGGVVGSRNTTRYIIPGMLICFHNGTTITAVRRVLSKTATTIVVDTAVTVTANTLISKISSETSNSLDDSGYNKEVMGLLGMIDDGSYVPVYFNIDRNVYPQLKAYVETIPNNGELTLDILQKCFDAADQRGNGTIKTLWGHHSARRAYLNLLQTFRRYNDANAMKPDGGFKGSALEAEITYAEVPFKIDRDAPYGMIFGIDDSYMYHYYVTKPHWADDDGRILLRMQDKDAYEARFRVFDNYVNDAPNTCFVIRGVPVTIEEILEY